MLPFIRKEALLVKIAVLIFHLFIISVSVFK